MAKVFVGRGARKSIKAFLVNMESMADLVFYEVNTSSAARGDALWYFVNSASGADFGLEWVKSSSQADIKVFKAKVQSAAKWKKSHKLVSRLG